MGFISLLVLGILVFVHELGHFLVAKFYGVGVLEFAIGFGPKVISKRVGETRYSIRLIPLGGFVRMVGDTPDQLIPAEIVAGEEKEVDEVESKLLADKSRWFLLKPVSARAAVVFAGPFFNVLFAVALSIVSIYHFGVARLNEDTIVGEVVPDFPAQKAGILKGDRILSVNGQPVHEWTELRTLISSTTNGKVDLLIERDDPVSHQKSQMPVTVVGQESGAEVDYLAGSGEGKKSFMIGLLQDYSLVPATIAQALKSGTGHVAGVAYMNVKSIVGLVKGIISPQHLGGPIMIFREAAKSAQKGFDDLADFMVFLSVSLAVLNLLPVPVLDGGHLLFFLIEAVRGKPLSLKVQDYATRVGMALLLMLMIYALRNDIHRLLT